MQALASIDPPRLRAALAKATAELIAERNALGFWEGELSSSALSTATAVTALALALKHGTNLQSPILNPQSSIDSGLRWLAEHQNADGGWGDTTKSLSNISTTTLCWAAFGAAGADEKFSVTVERAKDWLARNSVPPASRRVEPREEKDDTVSPESEPGGTPGARFADQLACAIIARYGKDRTFSVPILTMCALAGRLGEGREAWRHVIPLPFELAACPHQLFAALRLPVVSYALPALIAIGQARHVHAPSRNPFARLTRMATREKTLGKLTEIQPSNGGFLEATPLTSFVTMSLAASGQVNHIVTQRGLEFLLKSQRPDGSWPIDTNLSTWCTTLTIDALPHTAIRDPQSTIDWLLKQQYRTEHPYTHAAPGGWAWTDLPGGVPDADDTAGALLALHTLSYSPALDTNQRSQILAAAKYGVHWLLDLQNRDGGIPTFCRGWGALPFDRSSVDITAHAIRAWINWSSVFGKSSQRQMHRAVKRGVNFLLRAQESSGSFCPLWFGNQFAPDETNRVYGTSRVATALAAVCHNTDFRNHAAVYLCNSSVEWLVRAQNADGGWGGERGIASTTEETALALTALSAAKRAGVTSRDASIIRGAEWLISQIESSAWREPSPIGFYFAKLWYFERLYPMIFTVGALRAATEVLDGNKKSGGQ